MSENIDIPASPSVAERIKLLRNAEMVFGTSPPQVHEMSPAFQQRVSSYRDFFEGESDSSDEAKERSFATWNEGEVQSEQDLQKMFAELHAGEKLSNLMFETIKEGANTALVDLLERTPAKQIVPEREVQVLSLTDTIEDAVKLFSSRHITSAPVICPTKLPAAVDIADCLAYALQLKKTIKNKSFLSAIMADATIKDVLSNSEIENPTLLPDNTSAMKVFEELGNSITCTHRVLLINKHGDVQQLVSQSDCIRFIQTALERNFEIRTLLRVPMNRFGIDHISVLKPINSMLESGKVRDAIFRLVVLGGALPITTRDGHLIGHVSKSDFKEIFKQHEPDFEMNIVAFLRCYSPSSMFPRILNLNSTLDETITSMLTNSTHHLWVVNKDNVPIGCVSLTDLIRILMSIAEKPL